MLELNIIFLVPKFDSIYNLFMPISVELNDLIDPLVTSVWVFYHPINNEGVPLPWSTMSVINGSPLNISHNPL